MSPLPQRPLGSQQVSAIGLGAMSLSIEGRPGRGRAIDTVHAALDAGVTLIDTADSYYSPGEPVGHNETLIADALASYPDTTDVLIATKGGRWREADGSWGGSGTPEHLTSACEASLRRLRVDTIGLYQFQKPDPQVPWHESIGALADLVRDGKIRTIGISNVDIAQLDEAHKLLGDTLVSVQNGYSPAAPDPAVLTRCAELGLAYLAWGPLGGVVSGSHGPGPDDTIRTEFGAVAAEHRTSTARVGLAWLLRRSPALIPIPGSTRPETIRDSAAATTLELTSEQIARLDRAVA